MDIISNIVHRIRWEDVIGASFRVLLMLAAGWGGMLAVRRGLSSFEKRLLAGTAKEGEPPSETAKRIETLVRLLRQGMVLALWITIGLVLLREMGVEVGPLIASLGIAGVAVGFGAQYLVRDVIAGFFFILENQVRVGDVAVVNGTGGLVEALNFRTIVLRDLGGVVHVFPNGTVTTLSNLTSQWSAYIFDIGVAYKEDVNRVISVLKEVGASLKQDEKFGPLMLEEPEVFGVDKFADSAVVIKGRIRTQPIRQWMVGREFLRRVKMAFDERGIEIPYPHRTVFFGDTSKPFELLMMEAAGRAVD